MSYKLKYELFGHEGDVRCVSCTPEGQIISCSRDKKALLWSDNGITYYPSCTYSGHTNYISSICYCPPAKAFPLGLVVTGCNDKVIRCYSLLYPNPLFSLSGHTNTVCCVHNSDFISKHTLLSSSWDNTAILWDLIENRRVAMYTGHTQAVWCVIAVRSGFVVTASADTTVNVYKPDGSTVTILKKHTDCVRALCPVSDDSFLSCGNDGHVMKWKLPEGICEMDIVGSDSYLYSIIYISQSNTMVWCGESETIFIKSGSELSTVRVPSLSVWCVAVLPNTDILVGCSDGKIRVFTCDPENYAPESRLKTYEENTNKWLDFQNKKKPGEVLPYLNNLAGPEVLYTNGQYSGDIIVVREGILALLYKWTNHSWKCVGFKKGSYFVTTPNNIVAGKPCDYVFSIGAREGQQSLPLPFNLQDSPQEVAAKFLRDEELSLTFMESITKFISESVIKDFQKVGGDNSEVSMIDLKKYNKYYPLNSYITFENADLQAIIRKLREFGAVVAKSTGSTFDDGLISDLYKINESTVYAPMKEINYFLTWPDEYAFPALDLLRLTVRTEIGTACFFSEPEGSKLFSRLLTYIDPHGLVPNQIMALRVISNLFIHNPGHNLVSKNASGILCAMRINEYKDTLSSALQVALCTLILNLTTLSRKKVSIRSQCLSNIMALTLKLTDQEALFRAFVTFGSLISFMGSLNLPKEIADILNTAETKVTSSDSKTKRCLNELLAIIQ